MLFDSRIYVDELSVNDNIVCPNSCDVLVVRQHNPPHI